MKTKKGGINMEQKQMALLFVIGILVGAVAIYGAAITGYVTVRIPAHAAAAAGIQAEELPDHVIAVQENPALGMQVKEHLALRSVIGDMVRDGVLKANDQIFVHRGTIYTVEGNARSMEVLFVSAMRDGLFLTDESNALRDRCLQQDALKDKMFIALTDEAALVSPYAVMRGAEQLTALEAFAKYAEISSDLFRMLGIFDVVAPFGVDGSGTGIY